MFDSVRVVNAPRGVDSGRWAPPRRHQHHRPRLAPLHLHGSSLPRDLIPSSPAVACQVRMPSPGKHRTIHATRNESCDRPRLSWDRRARRGIPPAAVRARLRPRVDSQTGPRHGERDVSRERGTRKRPQGWTRRTARHGTAGRRPGVVLVPRAGVRYRPS